MLAIAERVVAVVCLAAGRATAPLAPSASVSPSRRCSGRRRPSPSSPSGVAGGPPFALAPEDAGSVRVSSPTAPDDLGTAPPATSSGTAADP